MMGRRSRMTWGAYSLRSSKKICMDWGVILKISSFSVNVVGRGAESEAKYQAGVTEGRNPNRAHPGGYSRRDALS